VGHYSASLICSFKVGQIGSIVHRTHVWISRAKNWVKLWSNQQIINTLKILWDEWSVVNWSFNPVIKAVYLLSNIGQELVGRLKQWALTVRGCLELHNSAGMDAYKHRELLTQISKSVFASKVSLCVSVCVYCNQSCLHPRGLCGECAF